MRFQPGRHRLVRQQHELFDQPVSDVPLEGDDLLHHSAFVHDQLGLVQVEVDRAAPPACVVEDLKELTHQLEHRHQRGVARRQLGIAVGQNRVHGGVRHPLVAVDDPVVKFAANDVAAAIDLHQAGLHQPIDMGIQAAQPGRQLRRKHVHGTLGKVHRRAALVGLAVERAPLLHVMRDVGNVHAEPVVAVRQPADGDGIVEVARVLAVDGHGGQIAKVGAAADIPLRDRAAEADRLGDRFSGMRVGNAVLPDDDLGVDAGRIDVAEHLGHAADRAARAGRPAGELHHDHLPRGGAALLAGRNEDVHQHAPVERHDIPHAAVIAVVAADDPVAAALQNADDAPFRPSALLDALDPDHHPITVHGFVQVRTGDVDIAAAVERPLARHTDPSSPAGRNGGRESESDPRRKRATSRGA